MINPEDVPDRPLDPPEYEPRPELDPDAEYDAEVQRGLDKARAITDELLKLLPELTP